MTFTDVEKGDVQVLLFHKGKYVGTGTLPQRPAHAPRWLAPSTPGMNQSAGAAEITRPLPFSAATA